MSDPFHVRSSVGSRRSSAFLLPLPPPPPFLARNPQPDANPLCSSWIRRLHLSPPPPPPPSTPAPPVARTTASTDESSTPPPRFGLCAMGPAPRGMAEEEMGGFGPYRFRAAAAAAAAPASYFRRPRPRPAGGGEGWSGIGRCLRGESANLTDFVRPPVPIAGGAGHGSPSLMFPGISRRIATIPSGIAEQPMAFDGALYHGRATDSAPIRTSLDFHDIQNSVVPQYYERQAPSLSSHHDEPFSYWNMGSSRRNITTSSVSTSAAVRNDFSRKRNATSTGFLPLKLRRLRGAI